MRDSIQKTWPLKCKIAFCISVSSTISIGSYVSKWILWVHAILQNSLLDFIPNIYNVKETFGCIELPA